MDWEPDPPKATTTTGSAVASTSSPMNEDNMSTSGDEPNILSLPTEPIAAQAYQATMEILRNGGRSLSSTPGNSMTRRDPDSPQANGFLAPMGSIVTLRDVVANPPLEDTVTSFSSSTASSLRNPTLGRHALAHALENLEGLEKEELEWQYQNPQTQSLTTTVMGEPYDSPRQAIQTLEALCESVPRRVCQHPFKRFDIVWVCRTCQADETCVLCHKCFKQSSHEGHDVAFYHAQAGGCCDCGDPDAWDPAGFCPQHGPAASKGLGPLNPSVLDRVRGLVPAVVDWMVQYVAKTAERGHDRASAPTTASDSGLPSTDPVSPGSPPRRRFTATPPVFDPIAAGSHKSLRQAFVEAQQGLGDVAVQYTRAERLGQLARQEGGLFLVLKSDDIHSSHQLVEALRSFLGTSIVYTDGILQKVARALRQHGQLIVWGSLELLAELNQTQTQLWLDGDRVACGLVGSAMLNRAAILEQHGLFFSILTLEELQLEQRAVAILQWLSCLARSCDPLCQTVAESIETQRHLVPLLGADFKLSSRVTKYWHSLLLTLLAVPTFKSHLAAAYCDTYQSVTAEYARGMGILERSGYALSVQFLNRVTYVVDLVQKRNLLGRLGASLLQTLKVAASPRLNPDHSVMTHRRYSPCISDLKCVLNVKGMPRLFASLTGTFLQDWIAALSLGQLMDPQIWREYELGHVEQEVKGWVGAFNASISLGSLFERLLTWDDNDPSPIRDPDSPLNANLCSCVELTLHILVHGISKWQLVEMETYKPTPFAAAMKQFQRCTASLPFSTLAAKRGSVLAFSALPMSQMTPFSFHLPLHRFVAACLREVCLRPNGMDQLQALLASSLSPEDHNSLFMGLMEFPVLVLSRAAQVRAGIWRRNGNGLNDQVLNYAEPPFCRAMRDADLLLVQFGMLGRHQKQTIEMDRPDSDVGVAFLVHLLIHRLGLFAFCGLDNAPNVDVNRYLDEVEKGIYPPEQNGSDTGGDEFVLPWTYSPASDQSGLLLLLEEFLHMVIILCSEIPPPPPDDKSAHTEQATWRLRREVVHRLASGPKTHSELAEVHHVLSHWDNVYLSEFGKLVNPDDATGAALGEVLSKVATRKVSRAKMEPDKWELNRDMWDMYDPSFYHISLRHHQTAAESRPTPTGSDINYGVVPKAFSPVPPPAHSTFARLRRDITCDATLLAIAYRTLHMHCRDTRKKPSGNLCGASAYQGDERSETALARTVHLLTLGAYAWQSATSDDKEWRKKGGGSIGSVFFDRGDEASAPTAKEWVSAALLSSPKTLQGCDWYEGEENCLQLLRRLAVDGGYIGCFIAQDRAVRAGAAWLCDFAATHNPEARNIVRAKQSETSSDVGDNQETAIEKRKRLAKEKAMERMKAQAAKFASMMKTELGDKEDDNDSASARDENSGSAITPPPRALRQGSMGSTKSSASSLGSGTDSDRAGTPTNSTESAQSLFDEMTIPTRLLRNRPQCIICSDDGGEPRRKPPENHRKSRRRRMDGGNALAFVGYTQASTVMKGGGGPPASGSIHTAISPVRRFVGAHVALCGHAIHSECWESYLETVIHREERSSGKREEFRCPLCQRLSNCLVPFIDVGVDWIDPVSYCRATNEANDADGNNSELMSVDGSDSESAVVPLNEFLSCTPWWVPRHNMAVKWDGQCAFVSASTPTPTFSDQILKPASKVPRRRSVRPLRKKDLYAAWNAMMKTPRFVRRKLRPRSETTDDTPPGVSGYAEFAPDFSLSVSAGETVVWRRFMDQVSDITYRADGKRLDEDNLHNDFGEFRHYLVEKYAYNIANMYAGREYPSDWPYCVFPSPLSDLQRQELSREKLLSKLMMSIQAFTYSCCCEANEAGRLVEKALRNSSNGASAQREENNIDLIFSKFGISGICCNGTLAVLPRPEATEDDGTQPFSGRLGRLRYLGLAVMSAAGAVAADLVQLVLPFPLDTHDVHIGNPGELKPRRCPIVYPLLYGHVLTHVVAALCASCGRARARSDSLELVWPVPFSSRGSFVSSDGLSAKKNLDSVVEDAEGFMRLGFLARVLQVLLGKIDMEGLNNIPALATESLIMKSLQALRTKGTAETDMCYQWRLFCIKLLEMAFGSHAAMGTVPENAHVETAVLDRFKEGCMLAADAACTYLSSLGVILQLLLPGVVTRYTISDLETTLESMQSDSALATLEKLRDFFCMESFAELLEGGVVGEVVAYWYSSARKHIPQSSDAATGTSAAVCSQLCRTQGFRVFDWPMDSSQYMASDRSLKGPPSASPNQPGKEGSMEVDPLPQIEDHESSPDHRKVSAIPAPFASKKSVPLIGGYVSGVIADGRPRLEMIPTSYTDLYAELGQLLPDSEQTAVCLVCGEVLNAGGNGECTSHSYRCGAGTGLFFLLQECAGLIMHNSKAAYIHSPFVDSHGETPQYRGRPLNLDLDRYAHLQEVWCGHAVRQQVVAERGGSRQIIVTGFY
eukprot:Nitzschia sp. Nitz4//scaffold194_size40385//22916//30332//NITZ4_007530-RA/size40385-processed-gene-0.16-mRNA-1//-1//CDS//3329540334//8381//frame0